MKKGIALVLTLALLLSMTLLVPMRHSEATSLVSATKSSSDPSSEEVVKEVFGALNTLDSLSFAHACAIAWIDFVAGPQPAAEEQGAEIPRGGLVAVGEVDHASDAGFPRPMR